MNQWLDSLQPQAVWQAFRLLCDTPRPSYNEQEIREKLYSWAQGKGLNAYIDPAGNLLIFKPATLGMEDREPVVLQGHLDMVAQKDGDSNHDFTKDPISTFEQDGWVHAKGTTLGADNGIGVAAILAVLDSQDLKHGPIEAVFTIEEETSLRGASQLEEGVLKGKLMLNLDSEDRGDVYIGCAGGTDINVSQTFVSTAEKVYDSALKITLSGLKGGHSGLDINKGLGNANVLMVRLLKELENNAFQFGLSEFVGGTLRNAIARDAFVTIQIKSQDKTHILAFVEQFQNCVKAEFLDTDPNLNIAYDEAVVASCLNSNDQKALLNALLSSPNGVHRMSPRLAGVVETSCNLGVIRLEKQGDALHFSVCLLVRSLVDSQTSYLAQVAKAPFELMGCEVRLENGYPGWRPVPDAGLLKQFNEIHNDVMGFMPNVKVIHAGLECGIIGAKYPGMEMVSFGPNIRGAHSPSERLEIASVADFWKLVIALLERVPKVNCA